MIALLVGAYFLAMLLMLRVLGTNGRGSNADHEHMSDQMRRWLDSLPETDPDDPRSCQ